MKVLLLSGPPRSGKDEIGKKLWNKLPPGTVRLKFAEPIIQFMFKTYGIRMAEVNKDEPHPFLSGRTPRQVAIAYSEKFCKPLFGQEYFGECALDEIKNMERIHQKLCIFTDSGFPHEARPVAAKYPTLQIRLSRPGTSFIHDSRSYWDLPNVGVIPFENDAPTLTALADKVYADLVPEIKKWLAL